MARLKGKRIFIFEDNPGNRAVMGLLLEQHGAVSEFERWGQNIDERLHAFAPIDMILLDLMYPNNVSGFDIFTHIRSIPEFEAVPIVAVSAADVETALPKAQMMGFSGFLSKPINLIFFPEQVASILDGKKIWTGR